MAQRGVGCCTQVRHLGCPISVTLLLSIVISAPRCRWICCCWSSAGANPPPPQPFPPESVPRVQILSPSSGRAWPPPPLSPQLALGLRGFDSTIRLFPPSSGPPQPHSASPRTLSPTLLQPRPPFPPSRPRFFSQCMSLTVLRSCGRRPRWLKWWRRGPARLRGRRQGIPRKSLDQGIADADREPCLRPPAAPAKPVPSGPSVQKLTEAKPAKPAPAKGIPGFKHVSSPSPPRSPDLQSRLQACRASQGPRPRPRARGPLRACRQTHLPLSLSHCMGGPTKGVPQTSGQKSAPRRGRGVMNQAASTRIPVCSDCMRQIRGPFVSALGKTWCPDHFVCSTDTCRKPLIDMGFVEEQGSLYCENCYEQYFAPICGKCDKRVKGDCLNAVGKQFHPECFCCAYCGKVFGSGAFYLEDGLPYCEADWNDLFTTKCVGCGFPIEAGDRWVEALNNNYHSQCFKCSKCHKNLEGQSFFAKGGKPFCKAHAQRGF
ncbi:LIM domain-binding protein 3 [Penaeus vannamei]|uniref:LIM domain-binding protein 3 n=1 Tax=Penaeus vannamei TaxID=6689 RepID=A0A3R7SYN0_PENVA|nr:LIM domain-binding protein 3 [Penaeus vannamei]